MRHRPYRVTRIATPTTVAALLATLAACGADDAGGGGANGGSGGSGAAGAGGSTTSSGVGGTPSGQEWQPPIGIPAPEFGIVESAEGCNGCSEVAVADPSQLSDIPAGTVVELSDMCTGSGTVTISGTGSADAPIIVRGPSREAPAKICQPTDILGSYLIVENVDFDMQGGSDGAVHIEGDHIALRHSEVHDYQPGHNSTVIYLSASDHVVLFANWVHDNGDFSLDCAQEQDVHGVGGTDVFRVWIVDSVMHGNRGDSIQFGHQASNTLGELYIGRNDLWGDGENCVDIKEASNVVVSENQLHATQCAATAVVMHDCPLNGAVIYNEIYDNPVGVTFPSLEAACDPHLPVSLFAVNNDFHDLDGGIEAWGSGKHYYIAGNTFATVSADMDLSDADQLDTEVQTAYDAFFTIYGIDISP